MLVSEIYLWGAIIVASLVFVGAIVLAFLDRQMLRRMLVLFAATVAQMAVVVGVVWVVYQTHAWWSFVLWYVLVLVLSVCWVVYSLLAMWKRLLWPVSVSMLVGSVVVAGSTLLCLPISVFMTVYSVLMACLTASMIQTMVNYQRSLRGQQTAEGEAQGSLSERILPQVRSMSQPLVMVIPTLFAGMLLGGIAFLDSLVIVLLLTAAAFVACILTGVIALMMLFNK